MGSYLSLEHIISSEMKTREDTRDTLQGIRDNVPEIIDLLCKLGYFFGKLEDVNSPRGNVQSICCIHFRQAPYSFWILYGLYEKGHYLEANIIYRHLIEAFIQMKYFHKYPEKAENPSRRRNFRIMFDEFASGYYEKYYHMLCDSAHGFISKDLFRTDRKSALEGRVRLGCEFNVVFATVVINRCVALLYGYLRIFDVVFPRTTIKSDEIIYQFLSEKKRWLMTFMESRRKEYPSTGEWYQHIFRLIQ